jgi:hypothetical protein
MIRKTSKQTGHFICCHLLAETIKLTVANFWAPNQMFENYSTVDSLGYSWSTETEARIHYPKERSNVSKNRAEKFTGLFNFNMTHRHTEFTGQPSKYHAFFFQSCH